jgi:hypothetical protein
MSVGFLTVAAGNLLVVLVGKLFRLDGAAWSWAFAAVAIVGALAFRAVTRAWPAPAAGEVGAGSQV